MQIHKKIVFLYKKSAIMKKYLLILFAVSCSLISFARSVNEVKQIIVENGMKKTQIYPDGQNIMSTGQDQ